MTPPRPAILLVLAAVACAPSASAPVERVVLPAGSSFGAMTDTLVARGVVRHRLWFRLLARLGHYDRTAKAGLYELHPGESALIVLRALRAGGVTVRLTVPEGYTLVDVAGLAQRELGLAPDSVLAAAREPAVLAEFGVSGTSLEGFLQPETYLVPGIVSARDLIRLMARTFAERWNPTWDQAAAAGGLSRPQVVTLASLVEGEARVDEDRPLVAAVYLNRLRAGMALQADPTVQYAIQLTSGRRKPRLYQKDYAIESPYNTYLHPGLPPGPVALPGRKSIEAVLDPARVPYLYFVAGPDGRHVFSRTYQEHLRAVARARRQLAGSGKE